MIRFRPAVTFFLSSTFAFLLTLTSIAEAVCRSDADCTSSLSPFCSNTFTCTSVAPIVFTVTPCTIDADCTDPSDALQMPMTA